MIMNLRVSGSLGTIIGSVRHLMEVIFSSTASYDIHICIYIYKDRYGVLTFAFRFGSLQIVKIVKEGPVV